MKFDIVDRIHLSKFRCQNIKAPVIILVYKHLNIPYENKLCTLCDLKEVGNEYHYVMKFTYCKDSRMKYIDKLYKEKPDIYKFVKIFKNKRIQVS